jgi:hypothetical protein
MYVTESPRKSGVRVVVGEPDHKVLASVAYPLRQAAKGSREDTAPSEVGVDKTVLKPRCRQSTTVMRVGQRYGCSLSHKRLPRKREAGVDPAVRVRFVRPTPPLQRTRSPEDMIQEGYDGSLVAPAIHP